MIREAKPRVDIIDDESEEVLCPVRPIRCANGAIYFVARHRQLNRDQIFELKLKYDHTYSKFRYLTRCVYESMSTIKLIQVVNNDD